jgi:putative ABC transport system permease protein
MLAPLVSTEVFHVAFARFRTHPVQTTLTLAGIVVGTASIISAVTLGLTGWGFVKSQIDAVGPNLIWASYQGTVTSGVSRSSDDQIREADLELFAEHTDLFTGVMPLVELHSTIPLLSRAARLTILGTTDNYPRLRKNLRILRGRFLDGDDLRSHARVCVVSRHLYEELFAADESAEHTVHALGLAFEVIGEFEESVDTLEQGDVTPETIFIPVTVAWFFSPEHRIDLLFADVRESSRIPEAVAAAETLLKERHHAGARYKVESMTAVIRVASSISLGLTVIFVLAAAVSVVVGGIGIMNILLASVDERTREIGLRKSVGASPRDILGQFLVEALLLGAAGAIVGVAVGVGIPLVAGFFVKAVAIRVSGLSSIFAFLFTCSTTVAFGLTPALRAARLSPIEALRLE